MTTRSLFLPLIAALALSAVAPADGRAAETAHGAEAKSKRVVLSPHAGQVVRSHRVRLRVRSRGFSGVLRARLNGVQIGDDFGRPVRGVRTLRTSVSHGLRRGRNVLRVTVRRRGRDPRSATVRFFVRTGRPLVGAGRDRRIVIGSIARLSGQLRRSGAPSGAKVRWRLVGGPRRGRAVRAGAAATTPARLRSPAGRTAGFLPSAPGSYTLELTHRAGSAVTTDRVTLDAVPRNPLVPIDTMVSTVADLNYPSRDQRGIRVGDKTYLLRNAVAGPWGTFYLQVLVLERKTLAVLTHRAYTSVPALSKDLNELDDTKLVILVAQPAPQGGIAQLNGVLGRIGVPDYVWLSGAPGTISVVGVPGTARGDADVNIVPIGQQGRMQGYLVPDQYLNYGFVPTQRHAFSYGQREVDPCTAGTPPPCDAVGYRLNVKQSRTFAARPGDNRVYNTGGRGLTAAQQSAEANRLADDLGAVLAEDVVILQAVGTRRPGETSYPAPVGAIDKAAMKRLAAAVAKVGGSRDAFNRSARAAGAAASGGAVYMLAGWAGAREGAGAEVAAGVDGAGDAPKLTFVLRPDRQSRLRPAQATNSGGNTEALAALTLKPPSRAWPLDDDPGAQAAIAFLGATDKRLGSDPRSVYWTQPLDETTTTAIRTGLAKVAYRDGQGFTPAQFELARDQLDLELGWVGNVRTYLANLSRPFSDNALKSWAAAQKIADRVYEDAYKPQNEVAFQWIELTQAILHLLGPLTHDITSATASAMEIGVWIFGASQGGRPTDGEVRVQADELGSHLIEQAEQAQATFDRMGDVIVSDYDKLSVLGKFGGCVASEPGCPKEYAFSTADRVAASADIYRGIEQVIYAKLLPLGYPVFALARQGEFEGHRVRPGPPDPRHYVCTDVYHPWSGYPERASTSLLQELDPVGQDNGWDTFVLSVPPGPATQHGTPPSEELLKRVFGPVSASGDPRAGGLGLSLARLALDGEHRTWFRDADFEKYRCHWEE